MGGAAARPPSSPPSSPRRLASRRFGPHRGASRFSRPRAAAASSSFVVNTHHTYTHPPPRRCLWRPSSLPPAQPRALRAFSAFYFGPGLPDLSHPPSRALFPTHTHTHNKRLALVPSSRRTRRLVHYIRLPPPATLFFPRSLLFPPPPSPLPPLHSSISSRPRAHSPSPRSELGQERWMDGLGEGGGRGARAGEGWRRRERERELERGLGGVRRVTATALYHHHPSPPSPLFSLPGPVCTHRECFFFLLLLPGSSSSSGPSVPRSPTPPPFLLQIGRASCRERV